MDNFKLRKLKYDFGLGKKIYFGNELCYNEWGMRKYDRRDVLSSLSFTSGKKEKGAFTLSAYWALITPLFFK